MNRNEELSSEYHCFGDLHVNRATYLIGLISIVLWVAIFIGYLYEIDSNNASNAALAFVGLISSGFLYLGNRRENSYFYTPYIAFNIADSAYTIMVNFIQILYAFIYLKRKSPTSGYQGIKSSGSAFGLMFACSIIVALCLARLYITFIVHRSYNYLRSKPVLEADLNENV